MTEFEAAYEFVRAYADAAAVAVRSNRQPDDRMAYIRFCKDRGLSPTPQRLELARDIAVAAREYFGGPGAEGRLVVTDAAADPEDLEDVPVPYLVDTLECHGWRADYLRGEAGP